jgi:hypothetical protein
MVELVEFVHGLFVALMMEAVRTFETSVYFNETTRRNIPVYFHPQLYTSCSYVFAAWVESETSASIYTYWLQKVVTLMKATEVFAETLYSC